ncbi:hypothetical protein AGABI2DRAFT_143474 [Agaricus bisporus var. bisporus H97]|uniref:hypothetical protein n=1 Tax=Agaricus bisporus var. bisporus (strain H97 / ATCC MYA-4626 / FGSC 10389) TaxID=936046 RepID=UPI00029F5EE9|nr:hypothetical protein AGABI2DRAFT_143474 [Agaricus bisporus var. bisporus H97]EKV46322.1 hypothetical protein AGABI2DRAFT_143474 [Agaricus bisporus var. bisporus H97]
MYNRKDANEDRKSHDIDGGEKALGRTKKKRGEYEREQQKYFCEVFGATAMYSESHIRDHPYLMHVLEVTGTTWKHPTSYIINLSTYHKLGSQKKEMKQNILSLASGEHTNSFIVTVIGSSCSKDIRLPVSDTPRFQVQMLPKGTSPLIPALLFGVVFDMLLFGILTAQVYIYYISFPKDRPLLKIAVYSVYLAGIAQTGLALADFYLSALQLLFTTDLLSVHPDHLWFTITALTSAGMIICMSLGQLTTGIIGAVCYSGTGAVSTDVIHASVWGTAAGALCSIGSKWIWGPLNILCDLTITICMVTFVSSKSYDHLSSFSNMILKAREASQKSDEASAASTYLEDYTNSILMSIYTLLACLWGSAVLGVTPWYPLPGLMMSKVYINSMLVLLNNRATIANGRKTMESFEFIEVSGRNLGGEIQLRTRDQNSTSSSQTQ